MVTILYTDFFPLNPKLFFIENLCHLRQRLCPLRALEHPCPPLPSPLHSSLRRYHGLLWDRRLYVTEYYV